MIVGVCEHGDVQLVPLPGSVSMAGRVEVCLDGVWSNICGRGWSNRDAVVVCRQLGYSSQGSGVTHFMSTNKFIVAHQVQLHTQGFHIIELLGHSLSVQPIVMVQKHNY